MRQWMHAVCGQDALGTLDSKEFCEMQAAQPPTELRPFQAGLRVTPGFITAPYFLLYFY